MMLVMLVFLAVVVWAVVMFTHSLTSQPSYHDHGEQATDPKRILDERFARGEIDEEEHRKRRDILQRGK
jgi:putative membrane protein